jgi:hypothetical protein
MRILAALALCAACLGSAPVWSAQIGDPNADVSVTAPAFAKDKGPLVAIDAGHENFHTIDGRYGPFARLLSNDGFRVTGRTGAFTRESLKDTSILVIANALNPANRDAWTLPTPSAFTPDEIEVVKAFVENGGSLLLIADHMPFGGAAADLAQAFGVTYYNGFAFYVPDPQAPEVFTVEQGLVGDDIILRGRAPSAPVTRIMTFTGSAFRAPASARRLLSLGKDHVILTPQTAWVFLPDTPRMPAAGLLQGAALTFGKGRVAVFGEAAMFTAQIDDADPNFKTGFTVPGAESNKQFALNVARWLAGQLGP